MPADPLAGMLDALADAVAAKVNGKPADALVAIAAEDLAELGLELQAVKDLIAEGRLRAVRIGRRTFTKRSYLLALVDELPPVAPPRPQDDGEEVDELAAAVSKAARRQARASVRKPVATPPQPPKRAA